ncbi:Bcr/CflA family efflux MFS transporter [Nocardia terpenica]|uniref:Bcr/CflA family efflux MFS transporter n=1 Tax=Nocardia terpenica TaxID=455432 RepID=UPI001895BF17|nr:Bcr/CflA family efflux MFS transporter [Nocardia terpenica]MBF6065666.1 Bcr/CflA family efflux MFS transporter [Nocardia terpenica]MBF6108296.1 Bcr/CflA family efflux MFS transporter [Nocardia terpenica]MBF6115781.1 Bcr/CflA family efflux MFS transporter [Nocardia terpenica]MBF6122911.1 Bcr/CflA family efflux MFS transporter [Nocardia terpenica]MBF6156016.1 Bcr/CflA family efflux MFS transporter [Nocardia terpenica]
MTAQRSETTAALAISSSPGGRIRLLVVLAGLSGVSPLATDMYIPALPDMAASLGTDASDAQLSLTGFLAGIIVGQLVLGPLSDTVGRRPVLLWGTLGFATLSVVCALAPTMAVLDIARCGQGISGGAGIVVARAVVTDLFAGRDLAITYSRLSAIGAAAPVLAPLAGGVLLLIIPWRGLFIALAIVGVLLGVGVWRWVPESHPPHAHLSGGMTAGLRGIGGLVARGRVLGPALAISFGGAAVFTYVAGTTFVFQDIYHLGPTASSMVYGVNAVGNMMGSLAYGRLVKHRSPETLLVASAALALTGPTLLLLTTVAIGSPMGVTWCCLLLSITAFGAFFPAVVTIGQQRGRAAPGATSALLGGGQFLFGAVASPTVGLFGTHSPAPMAAILVITLALATVAAVATARHQDRVSTPRS